MKRVGKLNWRDERGDSNPFLVATILLAVLLVAATGGFIWAYMQMVDWKTNGQAKIDTAVTAAKDEQKKTDEKDFAEKEKQPNLTYQGPSDLGSVRFNYPKTWATYVAESAGGKLSVYMNPQAVPKTNPGVTPYALRVDVSGDDYNEAIEDYQGDIEEGKVKASTIVLNKSEGFAGYSGMRFDGQLEDTINGSVVIFKVRDKTLKLYVDSQDYMNDFNNTILKTLKFEP